MTASRPLDLYDLRFPEQPRWVKGDQYIRSAVRRVLKPFRGRGAGGLAKVTANLTLGLEKLGIDFRLLNRPVEPRPDAMVGVLHGPVADCRGIAEHHPCIVGPGVLSVPQDWPDLFTSTQAVSLLQNCEWSAEIFRPMYKDRVTLWTMGVDHERYTPSSEDSRKFDFLVYDKIRWPETPAIPGLVESCLEQLTQRGCTWQYIRYGKYPRGRENAYHEMLSSSRAMLFLCECETQGFAYNEALSMNVPILAWNLGHIPNPQRFGYGPGPVPATSVPYWDDRCGLSFQGIEDFPVQLNSFLAALKHREFSPREYVVENLTLEKAAQSYLALCRDSLRSPSLS